MKRRDFLKHSLGAAALIMRPKLWSAEPSASFLDLHKHFRAPVTIAGIELLRVGQHYFVQSRSTDGVMGVAIANARIENSSALLGQRLLPYFSGKDARDLEMLVAGVATDQSHRTHDPGALWSCVSFVEFSLFDLLGKTAKIPVGALLGGVLRREIPVYLSSFRQETTPEQEIAWLSRRLAETNSKAIKLQIGREINSTEDTAQTRTKRSVTLARKTFGDGITIHVDANGAYDPREAVEVGKFLEAHHVYSYQEPCSFEDLDAAKQVASALDILVASVRRETSYEKFRRTIGLRAIDIVQPDIIAMGGFIRALRVAREAAKANMDVTLHSPFSGYFSVYMLQFASAIPNLGRFQEFRADYQKPESWMRPFPEVHDSLVKVPTGPGLGLTIDGRFLKKAEKILGV